MAKIRRGLTSWIDNHPSHHYAHAQTCPLICPGVWKDGEEPAHASHRLAQKMASRKRRQLYRPDIGEHGLVTGRHGRGSEIGRAHVCTPVTNAHLVCRLMLEKKQQR